MRARSLVPWLLVVSPIAVSAFGCYGATEVTIALSTDLACDGTVDTLLYKGPPESLDTTPSAETKSCAKATALGADNEVGSLTLTPSGDKSAQVTVKAVLARNGKDPAKCTGADPGDCIVATRTFSFSEHSSQRIAIRLLGECLGTFCPDGQTCVAGKCSSDAVSCVDTGSCADGGTVATDSAAPPTSSCALRGKAADGVLAQASTAPGDELSTLVRSNTPGVASTIRWIEGTVGKSVDVNTVMDPTTFDFATAAITPRAVGDGRDGMVASLVRASATTTFVRGTTAQASNLLGNPLSVAAASSSLGIVGTSAAWYLVDGTTAATLGVFAVQRVAGAADLAVASTSDQGIHVYDVTLKRERAASPVLIDPTGGTKVALAVSPSGAHAYASGTARAGGNIVIAELTDTTPLTSPFRPGNDGGPITSLAADEGQIFYTRGGETISAVTSKKTDARVAYSRPGAAISHLEVDDDCLYFWEVADGKAVLRAVGKP